MSLPERLSPPKVTVDLYLDSNIAVQAGNDYVHESNIEHMSVPAISAPSLAQDAPSFNGDASTAAQSRDLGQDANTSLGQCLRKCAIPHVDGGNFWPPEVLHKLLSKERITEELNKFVSSYPSHHDSSDHEAFAVTIMSGYSRIFALLCLLDKSGCIRDCINENVKDSDLPFAISKTSERRLSRAGSPEQYLQCFQQSTIPQIQWQENNREYISQNQDGFNPVVFGLDTNGHAQHIVLSPRAVLPFEQLSSPSMSQRGGFAMVDRVAVHPGCHRFHDILPSINTKNLFARKKLDPRRNGEQQQRQEFEKEISILNRFSELKHGHLVKLLASWTQPRNNIREYCLLFPLANGDLDWYWTDRSLADTTVRWISRQVLGLSDALRKIHDSPLESLKPESQRKYGRHGDLKPENILWYDSPNDAHGILVIADMGASDVNSVWSKSAVKNQSIQHTPRYKPPECDLEGGQISRSYDIWTFGCILLEMVCWCLRGQTGRQEFDMERFAPYPTGAQSDMFFDIKPAPNGGYVVLVKECVTNTIARLHHHPSCTRYFHDLLYLIEEQMIVTLSVKTNRITSAKLYETVVRMEASMNEDPSYYSNACPMPRPAKRFDPVDAKFRSQVVKQIQGRVQGLNVHTGPTQRTKSVQQLMHMS